MHILFIYLFMYLCNLGLLNLLNVIIYLFIYLLTYLFLAKFLLDVILMLICC